MTRNDSRHHLSGRALLGAVLALSLGMVGCAAQGSTPPPPAGASTAAASPQGGTAATPPHDSVASPPPVPATLQDGALRLESLLGQHAVLAADMMRGRIRNDEDFGQAASAAVTRNTDDLAQLVGALSGAPAADQFRALWANHVIALFTYSRGLASDDAAARDQARAELVRFENDIAAFFASAAQGRLSPETARSAVLTHVDHLLAQADAYAVGDYARSNELYRQGYTHTFGLGHALATTLLPADQAAVLTEPQWRVRSELGRLLGEHVALAVAALRAGAAGSPDSAAARAALDGNTDDLTGLVGSLFGEPTRTVFRTLWAEHINQLVAYTAAVAAHDPGRRDAAQAALRGLEQRAAGFLDAAAASNPGTPELVQALVAHDDMLLRQVDAFVAKDYRQSNDLSYRAYQDMFGLAGQLSDAFGATVAARLPASGAPTGSDGTAPGPR
jgi:hypothetical protein